MSATLPSPPRTRRLLLLAPGIAAAAAIAVVATLVGRTVPVIGGPVTGIVLGVIGGSVLRATRPRATTALEPGVGFAGRQVLQASVVVLGAQLSIGEVARIGLTSLPVMLGTLAVCLVAAWGIGRALGVIGDLRTLIGVGTGICGASAIAAVTPVIGAASVDVAYAVSTIFVCNVAAVIAFPLVGHLLGMGQHAFGLFAGTAVNDTSSVVAAATTYGRAAADTAVVVKLVRTLMIIPITIGLAALAARGSRRVSGERRPVRIHRLVPWFLLGFLLVVLAGSIGLVPAATRPTLAAVATFMITVAMSGIGLSTDVGAFRRAGVRPLALGVCLWIVVALTSLGIQAVSGTL